MSEKVVAEGSLWMIQSELDDAAFARATGAVKVTTITPDVRRVYFLVGQTPAPGHMTEKTGANKAVVVVGPEHTALVTPTVEGSYT